VPILVEALHSHADSYVQFRAIVLVYGFDLPRRRAVFDQALESPNDRVRATAYEYFEQFSSRAVVPKLIAALDTETSEFVRPYLVRALAANDDTQDVKGRLIREIERGEGYFRGAVIEALGDYGAEYAVDALIDIVSEDGPLRDDALLALGKIGDRRAVGPVAAVQADADETLQPVVSATACLLDIDCESQFRYVTDALGYGAQSADGDDQELLRSASSGLAALAITGNRDALDVLFDVGVTASDQARAPIAIAIGTVAFRNPAIVRRALVERGSGTQDSSTVPENELMLLRDAFDMLDEDFAEERFYVLMRGDYWTSPEGSDDQSVAEAAIRILEF
jgi:HEAT repeat protein